MRKIILGLYITAGLVVIMYIVLAIWMCSTEPIKKKPTLVETLSLSMKEHPNDWTMKKGDCNNFLFKVDTLQNKKCNINIVFNLSRTYIISPDLIDLSYQQADSLDKAYNEFIEEKNKNRKIDNLINTIQNCNTSPK